MDSGLGPWRGGAAHGEGGAWRGEQGEKGEEGEKGRGRREKKSGQTLLSVVTSVIAQVSVFAGDIF